MERTLQSDLQHFYDLLAKPVLLMGKHVPGIGLNQEYERNTLPQYHTLRDAMRDLATAAV